eukprot:9473416-Pyramimonas_sp.AAC.1
MSKPNASGAGRTTVIFTSPKACAGWIHSNHWVFLTISEVRCCAELCGGWSMQSLLRSRSRADAELVLLCKAHVSSLITCPVSVFTRVSCSVFAPLVTVCAQRHCESRECAAAHNCERESQSLGRAMNHTPSDFSNVWLIAFFWAGRALVLCSQKFWRLVQSPKTEVVMQFFSTASSMAKSEKPRIPSMQVSGLCRLKN